MTEWSSRRAFVVDESAIFLRDLRRDLASLGFDVCGEAGSGEDALERIPDAHPDVVLTGIDLGGGLTGVDVAERLRDIIDVPVVFVTAVTDASVVERACRASSYGFLVKPFHSHVLAATLDIALLRHATDTRLRAARQEVEAANFKLRESAARFQQVVDHISDAIVVDDLDGVALFTNNRFRDLFGLSRDEPLDTRLEDHVSPASRAAFRDHRAGRLRGESALAYFEFEGLRRDGSVRWIDVQLVPVRDVNGHVIGSQAALRDITDRKRAEAVTAKLVEQAAAANLAKTHFLAVMSHELRTPLNAVLGLSEALLERTYGELTERQQRSLQTIHESGGLLLHLINDTFDIARIEAGKLAIESRDTALWTVVGECFAFVRDQADAKNHRLVLERGSSNDVVRADPRRLRQLLLNLLTNAIKFSPAGGTIAVGANKSRVAGYLEVWVTDTGPGIAPCDRERIFEPFVTLDHPHPRDSTGAGLGLALVKRLSDLHGGSVRVESAAGSGARFVVTLPEASREPQSDAAALPSPVAVGQKRVHAGAGTAPLILLVEDSEASILALEAYLKANGYRVQVARDGKSAVSAGREAGVALILMDIRLPVMDGLEAIRQIRAADRTKPILALTACAMPGDEQRCLEAGATLFLAKPVALRALIRTIHAELKRRNADE